MEGQYQSHPMASKDLALRQARLIYYPLEGFDELAS